jgi:hypothetical protein
MAEATKVGRRLHCEDLHSERAFTRTGPIIGPAHLFAIVVPPLVLTKLIIDRPRNARDVLMLFLVYPRLLHERCVRWSWAWQPTTYHVTLGSALSEPSARAAAGAAYAPLAVRRWR